MSQYEDMDEELRRILDEGSASAQPAELADLRSQLAQQPDTSGDLPAGTKVEFTPEVAAPPTRTPLVPPMQLPAKVVQVPAQSPDDMELAAAKVEDRTARSREALERGTRQIIGGLTRTDPVASQPAAVDAVKELYARRRQKDQDALRGAEAANNAARTKAYLDSTAAAGPRSDRKLTLEEQALKAREDAAKAKADETGAHFEETRRHNKATEGIGWTNANKPAGGAMGAKDENGKTIPERRQELRENALKPRAGWEPIEADAPTFRDADQAKRFDRSNESVGAIKFHRDHVLESLKRLEATSDPAEADIIIGEINAQMGPMASKLRDAEGLNNTDAANHVAEGALSMSGGSIINVRNMLNKKRLPAIINAAIASSESSLDAQAAAANLRRSKGGKAIAPGEGAKPVRKTLKDGRVVEKHADGLWYPVGE